MLVCFVLGHNAGMRVSAAQKGGGGQEGDARVFTPRKVERVDSTKNGASHSCTEIEEGNAVCPLTGCIYESKQRVSHYSTMEHAISATAACQAKCRDKNHALEITRFFMTCTDDRKSRVSLAKTLDKNPLLVLERSSVCTRLMPIGWTALHAAAWAGAAESCRVLLSRGAIPFERDLTGRLPLHIVAASEKKKKGHIRVCELLLAAMQSLSGGKSVVGSDAPTDLAGLTPSAWLLASSNRDPKHLNYVEMLKAKIYTPGDKSISPFASRRRERSQRDAAVVGGIRVGHGELPGWRLDMEDAVTLLPRFDAARSVSLFGVFDGHGGDSAAKFCAEHLGSTLRTMRSYGEGRIEDAMRDVSIALDRDLSVRAGGDDSGAVGIFVLVTSDHIFAANVGDARVVLARCRSDRGNVSNALLSLALTKDHKASTDPAERERVLRTGATLTETGRVQIPGSSSTESLAVTRAFGDFSFKTAACAPLTAEASVTKVERTHNDRFVVLACDGVWDVMSNSECIDFVAAQLEEEEEKKKGCPADLDHVCTRLLFRCLEKGSQDNMTAVIILFDEARGESSAGISSVSSKGGLESARKALFV